LTNWGAVSTSLPDDGGGGEAATEQLNLRVLGPVEVWWKQRPVGVGSAKPRALVARLLIDRNRVVSADRLVEDVWPESPLGGADIALRSTVSRIRKRLRDAGIERDLIGTRPAGYILEADDDEVDSARFERLVTEGQAALIDGQVNRGAQLFCEAVALWRGDALGEFSAEPFARAESRRLEELRLAAIEGRVEAELMLGHHGQLIAELEALTAAHPFRERLWGQRMVALYRAGRQADALRVYQEVRKGLIDELGLEPGPDLARLEQDILSQHKRLDWTRPGVPPRQDREGAHEHLRAAGGASTIVPFVGRDRELGRAKAWWERVGGGPSELLVVTGESGIGKTRLVENVADAAASEGAIVLCGRCDEELIGPYQPFAEVIAQYVRTLPAAAVSDLPGWRRRELARLVPELGDYQRSSDPGAGVDPQMERFRFFEAVTSTLIEAARSQQLLLILDDLHWADRATVLLLRHLMRSGSAVGPSVVGIYTDTALGQRGPLRELLADLRREREPERITLNGLDEPSVRLLLASTGPSDAPLAGTLHGLTDGNPLLLGELLRERDRTRTTLTGPDDASVGSALFPEMAIPEAVKELVARRISRLPDNVNRFLQIAAVAGAEFDAEIVGQCAGMSADDVLDALDYSVQAGVLLEVAGAADHYVFTHALFREAIYSELLRSRRVRFHDRIAALVEESHHDRLDHHLNELAYHYSRGALQANAEKAISYLTAAGERALRVLAFEEAVEHFIRALDVVERVGGGQASRCDVLLALGEAQNMAGDSPAADRTFEEAASLARSLGDDQRLARAALRAGPPSGMFWSS
jgi:DNA-binding SARP family transcriptional activator